MNTLLDLTRALKLQTRALKLQESNSKGAILRLWKKENIDKNKKNSSSKNIRGQNKFQLFYSHILH